MKKLSVVVITRNEEKNLGRCLEAVKWADEIVITDFGSTDDTLEIAKSHGARIFTPQWRGFGRSKQSGVDQAEGEWILSLDADEQVTAGLADEIRSRINGPGDAVGFFVPRRTRFLGRWMRHGGWYPDYVLRLFRKDSGAFSDVLVHEEIVVTGPTERLDNDLLHFCYPSLENYLDKLNRYTTLAAEELYQKGRRSGVGRIILNSMAKFVKQYILKAGFLDGSEGLILALLSSGYVLTKYAKLRDLVRGETGESG